MNRQIYKERKKIKLLINEPHWIIDLIVPPNAQVFRWDMYYRSFEFNWFKEPYGELMWQNQFEIEIPLYVAAGKKICFLIIFERKLKSNLTPKGILF